MPRPAAVAFALGILAGCADTNALPPDPIELFVVANTEGNTLTMAPVDQSQAPLTIQLGSPRGRPMSVAAVDRFAMVPMGDIDQVAVVDLTQRTALHRIVLPAGAGVAGAIMLNDSIGYVANARLNTISQLNVLARDTAEVAVGVSPQGFAFARGRLFVLNGNLDSTGEPVGASWLTVINPATNALAPGIDSVPLTGPGYAAFATVAGDGLIYIVNRGRSAFPEGRLSVVDPLERREVASFAGLGLQPGQIATDGRARVFVSSLTEGLLEFNTASNALVRGEREGVPIPSNSGVAVDRDGRVYAIEAGRCTSGQPGFAHVLDEELEEIRVMPLGRCAGGALVVRIGGEADDAP
jgi:hypothetical protein